MLQVAMTDIDIARLTEEVVLVEKLVIALGKIASERRDTDPARRMPRYELVQIARKAMTECGLNWPERSGTKRATRYDRGVESQISRNQSGVTVITPDWRYCTNPGE